MGYASPTRGFQSGGWNARDTVATALEPFGPETLWSYELGMRGDFFDDRVRLNANYFITDLEDLQTTAATPSGQFLTTNAGGLDVSGLEFELTIVPNDNWDIFIAGGLLDAEYNGLQPCTAPNTTLAAYDVNCNVADPKRSPESTLTLVSTVTIPVSAWGASLQPTATMRYIGENVVGTSQQGVNDSDVIVNAGIVRWSTMIVSGQQPLSATTAQTRSMSPRSCSVRTSHHQ